MFLTFVSPPKYQGADVRFPNSVYGKNESRCRSEQQCSIYSLTFFRGVVVRFRKAETHTNALQRQNTLQTMAIEVRKGQAAAARQMGQGLPHLRAFLMFCACVRAGANLPPTLETTSGEETPCPDLRDEPPFRWIFRSWKLSEPTFVSTCSVHRSYCTSRRILYRSRSIAYIGVP